MQNQSCFGGRLIVAPLVHLLLIPSTPMHLKLINNPLCYSTDQIIIREVQLKSCHTLIKKCSFNFFEQCSYLPVFSGYWPNLKKIYHAWIYHRRMKPVNQRLDGWNQMQIVHLGSGSGDVGLERQRLAPPPWESLVRCLAAQGQHWMLPHAGLQLDQDCISVCISATPYLLSLYIRVGVY